MLASAELARLQHDFEPWAADRCGPLLANLTENLSADLTEMVGSGALLLGEIGLAAPNANTRNFPDGSHLVTANSGLIDFDFAVAGALLGGTRIFTTAGDIIEPALQSRNVAKNIAALYEAWRSGAIWKAGRLVPPSSDLPAQAAKDADRLGMTAVMFVLAHELGHVFRFRGEAGAGGTQGKQQLTYEEELGADKAAVRLLFEQGRKFGSIRLSLAGAVVALRVLAGLEEMGHQFPGSHPLPAKRLSQLWSAMRDLSGPMEEDYWHETTIAYAFDEHMEAAENLLLGRGRETAMTAERIFSRLNAVLEECVKDSLSLEASLAVINSDFSNAPQTILEEVAEMAARIMQPLPRGFIAMRELALQNNMAKLFLMLLPQYPLRFRAVFDAAECSVRAQRGI
jgi:hypothetical protein